jgi:acetylornithine deacetylase/succinyl-diaminopimelate desuccinylase-like protein
MARLAAVSELRQDWLEELSELVRIPSVSADPERHDDVRAAADWVVAKLRAAGGGAEVVEWPAANGTWPLAIGELRASANAESAPTVLCYGHFDVQPPAPLELWETPPFEPTVRGEWLYGRGIADDKGQLWMLLKAAELLAEADELPVNLRFACDGEEEIGGHSVVDWLSADERGADAGIVFDSGMQRRGAPEFNLAVRGLCYFHVAVRTGERDLHSGMYGGVSLNATHALLQTLSGVLARDGRLPEPLRAGIAPPTEEELAGWRELQPGGEAIAEQGSRPMDPAAGGDFYVRTWAEPAVDVHGLSGGSPQLVKTVLPVEAEANVSIRLAPGQDPVAIAEAFERLLRDAAPAGADVEVVQRSSAPPGLISPESPVVGLAQDAFEHVTGVRPLLVRSGGSIPLVPALAARGIPVIVTGFALPDSNVHSPNERMLVDYMSLGVATARELFLRLAALG